MKPLRISVHDFVGHAFQTQLSLELARRGHFVQHLFFSGFRSPNDAPEAPGNCPRTFSLDPITLGSEYPKHQYLRRYFMDRHYLKKCLSRLSTFNPEVVLSANASPAIQAGILRFCNDRSIAFVNWVQDCYGIAAEKIFSRRFGLPGRWIGRYVRRQENRVVYASHQVVFISRDFHVAFPNVQEGKSTVIENWAPLNELPPRPKMNSWSVAQGLLDKRVFLYSGTLGLKHNPELLVQLAIKLVSKPDAIVVVISEGLGRTYLETRKQELNLSNLLLFDFQQLAVLPDVIASADVLIAIIGEDAGAYSVPSKVLTYLCAERPLLLAIPKSNLAARIVTRTAAGIVVEPHDIQGFVRSARDLLAHPERAKEHASLGRAYAVSKFDIGKIADRFETVLFQSLQPQNLPRPAANRVTAAGI